jgi:LPS sulfotransferase NodH
VVRSFRRWWFGAVLSMFPDTAMLERPVFIVGCGRSGTTILGKILSRHHQVVYLNEPRKIWCLEPRTDIWNTQAGQRGGRLDLSSEDVTPAAAARLRRRFAVELRAGGGERLVEKLPINSFRIGYINALFPDALFVHLLRNGIEVARSIGRYASTQPWFGHEDYKWRLLVEYARARGEGPLVELCTDNTLRGMLEWYLSVTTAREALRSLPAERSTEVRYEDLCNDPVGSCARLERFIGLEPSDAMRSFAKQELLQNPKPGESLAPTPAMSAIAGELLAELGYQKA